MRLVAPLNRVPARWWLIGVALVVVGFAFYWVAVRPVLIKQSCSWTTYTIPAKEAFAGITQEEANKINRENEKGNPSYCTDPLANIYEQTINCKQTDVRAQPPHPAEPAREVRRNATKSEYEQCLRHNGLF